MDCKQVTFPNSQLAVSLPGSRQEQSSVEVYVFEQDCRGAGVSMLTGETIQFSSDITVESPIGIEWQRIYRSSKADHSLGMGFGWRHLFQVSLVECCEPPAKIGPKKKGREWIEFTDEQGRVHTFDKILPGQSCFQADSRLELCAYQFGLTLSYDIVYPDESRLIFKVLHGQWQLSEVHRTQRRVWLLQYDINGRLFRIVYNNQRGVQLKYDRQNQLIALFVLNFIDEKLQAVSTPIVRYEYDSFGHLITTMKQQGSLERYTYDVTHRLLTRVHPCGLSHYLRWEGDVVSRCHISKSGNDDMATYRFCFNHVERQSTCMDERGGTETFEYDIRGKQIQYIDPNGHCWRKVYNASGQLSQLIEPLSGITTYEYNEQGMLERETNPSGHHTYSHYNRFGHCDITIQPDGTEIQRILTPDGLLQSERLPDNRASLYEYDSKNLLIKHIDFDRTCRTFIWGKQNERLADTIAGATTRYSYNEFGALNAILSPTNLLCTWFRDEQGRLERVEHYDRNKPELKQVDTIGYDPQGRLSFWINSLGHLQSLSYTDDSEPKLLERPDGTTLAFTYDKRRSLTGIERSDGCQFLIEYDLNKNPIRLKEADGRIKQYQFDPCNRVLSFEDGKQRFVALTRDQLGRITHQQGSLKAHRDPVRTHVHNRFKYDVMGRIIQACNGYQTVTERWDEGGKLISSQQGSYHVITFEYDRFGRRTTLNLPNGPQIQYSYDKHGRLMSMHAGEDELCHWSYDNAGQPVKLRFGNGIETTQQFDVFGRLLEQTLSHPDALIDDHCLYRYNKGHQLVKREAVGILNQQVSFEYDQVGQLSTVCINGEKHQFAKGSFGNPNEYFSEVSEKQIRVTGDLVYVQDNVELTYDESGNQTQCLGRQRRVNCSYNALNQLIDYRRGNDVWAQYEYDAFGRRCAKTIGRKRIQYIWDGDQLIGETCNGLDTWYLYPPGSFVPVALIRDGQVYFYHNDQLGTPRFVTNTQCEVAWQNQSDVYGKEHDCPEAFHVYGKEYDCPDIVGDKKISFQSFEQPLRFPGQYHDAESGYHYNRYRYYSPQHGRYISQNPLGIVSGLNPYQYAPDPVNWVNTRGLQFQGKGNNHFNLFETITGQSLQNHLNKNQYLNEKHPLNEKLAVMIRDCVLSPNEQYEKPRTFIFEQIGSAEHSDSDFIKL